MEHPLFIWLIAAIAAFALLTATWFAAEWACRRIATRYAGRRRLWNGLAPEDDADEE
jgi:hypothetical protein